MIVQGSSELPWHAKRTGGSSIQRARKLLRVSPNTVLKWSRSLQAAFERANRNAGRKCVRGVVDERRLLTVNPWNQFTWIGGRSKPIRQFDMDELLSFLD